MSPDDDPPVTADDITWTSSPLPRLEDRTPPVDLVALAYEDLVVYCYDLQCELRTIRTLWHDTIGKLVRVAAQRDRALAAWRKARR